MPAGGPVVSSSRVVFPLPEGTWVATSPFGMRVHPITGEYKLHTGADFGAADGTSILAAADRTIAVAEFTDGYGGLIVIEHTIDGHKIATAYAHMWQHGIHVKKMAVFAAFAGARACCVMKHVGLNVAADPFMTTALYELEGGMLLIAADDPGPHSSQNEQETTDRKSVV